MSAAGDIFIPEDIGEWAARAACKAADGVDFFPGPNDPDRPARQVCKACPVREECREYAIPQPRLKGIWGGLSERERHRLRQARRRLQ